MMAMLVVISARLADVMREEEKNLTEIEARNLAEHLANLPNLPDADEWAKDMLLVRGLRLDAVNMQLLELSGTEFIVLHSTNNNPQPLPTDVAAKLRNNEMVRVETGLVFESPDSVFRVYMPIVRNGKVTGAVGISDHLDNLPTMLQRSLSAVLWLGLLAVVLIAISTFIMFRDLFYRPLDKILDAITSAKAGELNTQTSLHTNDEMGRLGQEFNSMMSQIHIMTKEREQQQEILQTRVNEATAQLTERNVQLENSNLELWQTTRRLTQLERLAAAGQTAAQFAHEVGTPLNLISCHAELLQADNSRNSAIIQERTGIIIEQIERIERIVRTMLDRTRTESITLVPLSVNAALQKVVEATSPLLDQRKITLHLALTDPLPLIEGEADKLQQVFINLINNALDAMPNGGEITLTTYLENNNIILKIADIGVGMNADVQARIFDPLYTTKERGTGLGLVIVHKVMQEHRGSITVSSQPSQGSVFTLTFPAIIESVEGKSS